MKKTNTKKLSIDKAVIRQLDVQLTPEQLRRAGGGAVPEKTDGCGSIHAVC